MALGNSRKGRGKWARVMVGLTSIVTLWLVFYVFQTIIQTVKPNMYSCGSGLTLGGSFPPTGTAICYNATNLNLTNVTATESTFGGAVTLLANLPTIVGLIATLVLIIYVIRVIRS